MKYAHILARATGSPWLITEAGSAAVMSLINSRLAGEMPGMPEHDDDSHKDEQPMRHAGTAIINIHGILGKNLGMMEALCGGCDINSVLGALTESLAAPDVARVVLCIDSPGGSATGIPEAHAAIGRLRAQSGKAVYAFTDGYCASAAYYLAAACDGIFCTPTANLGSIGVITQLAFKGDKLKQEGVEVRTYKYGKFKDLGNPARTPTPEEEEMIQARVDTLGKMFESDMRAARPQAKDEVFEARVYFGADAVAAGLADEVVPDMDTLLGQFLPAAHTS